MGKEFYRIGDLVQHKVGYNNGTPIDVYARVENIVDNESDDSYYEYDVVTGYGDKNSNITIIVRPLAYCKDLSYCDLGFISVDTHHVYKKDINLMREEIDKKMKFLEKKLEFVNKNENRIDKLDKILEK